MRQQISTEKLKKYVAGDVSQEEKEAIQLWVEEDEENQRTLLQYRRIYDITLAYQDEPVIIQYKKKRNLLLEIAKIAAVILLTLGCSYYFLRPHHELFETDGFMQTFYVPAGHRAELSLSDGTKVWLNALTTLTFPERFNSTHREIFLDGEAYFDVRHEDGRPFTVRTEGYAINVLGTEFNVKAYAGKELFETSLIKGSVEVVSQKQMKKITLLPGYKTSFKGGGLVTEEILHYDYFLWRKGVLCFDQENIEDILKTLQIYYDVEINNINTSIKEMHYTGKFRLNDRIEHVLNVLKIPTGLNYTKDYEDNSIMIW